VTPALDRGSFEGVLRKVLAKHGLERAFAAIARSIAPAIRVERARLVHEWVPAKGPREWSESAEQAHQAAYDRMAALLRESPLPSDAMPLGASRLGGQPDLSAGFAWPQHEGRSLGFLGQFNLAEAPALAGGEALPRHGQLAFFYEGKEQPWGFDPAHAGAGRVVYDPSKELVRHLLPADIESPDIPAAVSFVPIHTVPTLDADTIDWQAAGIDPGEIEWYELEEDLGELRHARPQHHLMGEPRRVQGEMRVECQLVSSGFYCGDETGYEKGLADPAIVRGIDDWTLLYQCDSDDTDYDGGPGIGNMWGDCGLLYFWIRKSDLAARRFERTWTILQCS
jgi:uncharacterized protein YwqG